MPETNSPMSINVICPEDCTLTLPPVKFSECAPKLKQGQITDLFLAIVGMGFNNWEDITEWASRIDQTDIIDTTKVRHLTISGDQPAPEITYVTISHKRKIVSGKKRVINIEIEDNSDENYDFMRVLECGGSLQAWYLTNAGDLYGDNSGIRATVNLSEVIPKATEELTKLVGTVEWDELISPKRIPSPFILEDDLPVAP